MTIQVDISWREQYVSHALNRKFAGVIPTGIYRGYACDVATDGAVTVGHDGVEGIAVAEVNGYSVTVRMDAPETVQATPDKPLVVLNPYYAQGVATRASIEAVATPEAHHIVLIRAEQDSGGAWRAIESDRQEATWHGANVNVLAQMATAQMETMEQQMSLHQRLFALEQAAG